MGTDNQMTAKMISNKDHQVINYAYGTKGNQNPVFELWSESILNSNWDLGDAMFTSAWR